ncbi:MAG: COX15/CtaA family protein [Thermoanaerobaculum sp.]|nr:COX15/CtaA family protein [Thermoanaerobaculum sp.]
MERQPLALPLAMATAVSMWAVGYLARLPGVEAPSPFLGVAFLVLYFLGGWVAGKVMGGGFWSGAKVGALTSLVNLLILGSLLGEGRLSPWVFIPGALLSGALLAGLGGVWARPAATQLDGAGLLARTAVVATFLLVVAGGLVTSHGAGLAVPDWPNTYGTNMFLFPLSRMTGGVYYEHAHRLFGGLVGLTTLALAVYLTVVAHPRRLSRLGWGIFFLVVVQGVLGGLRVTGTLTFSQDPQHLKPVVELAVVHGVLGQVVLASLVALAVLLTGRWTAFASRSQLAPRWLVALLLLQLVVGAWQRHLAEGLLFHISLASLVVLLAAWVGWQVWMERDWPLRSLGRWLVLVACGQFLLGFAALWTRGYPPAERGLEPLEVWVTTAHQAGGALLLSLAVAVASLTWPKWLAYFGVRR